MNRACAATLAALLVVLPVAGFAAGVPGTGQRPKGKTPVYSVGKPEWEKAEVGQPPKSDALDVACRGRIALTLNAPIKISVSSPESRPYGEWELRSIHLHEACFRLDEQSHLVAVFDASQSPIEPDYRSHGEIHVAVFDDSQRLLGTARKPYAGSGYWSTKPITEIGIKINLDFGISSAYKDARFFQVTITENPVPREQR